MQWIQEKIVCAGWGDNNKNQNALVSYQKCFIEILHSKILHQTNSEIFCLLNPILVGVN